MDIQDKSKEELIVELQELQIKYNSLKELYSIDITGKKQDDDVLHNERILLRTLIDNIPDLVYCKDLACRKTLANEADIQTLKRHSENEVLGKDDFEFYPKDIADKFYTDDKSVIETGVPVINREEYFLDDKGQKRWLLSSKIPLRDKHNKIIGLIGIGRDITERKSSELLLETQNEEYLQLNEELTQTNEELIIAKEKAEESDYLKTAFLHNMSHEIRTPMNAIIGFSELLIENNNNCPKLLRYCEIINQSALGLLDIINNILNIAQIESGQLPVNLEKCNLNELFSELSVFFTEYQKRIGKQNIELILNAQINLTENIILTDKGKLKQILINLVNNAFKFTITGKIEGGCKYDNNHKLIFFVSDTGIGIPPDKQKIIFERFTQLNQSPNKNTDGNGLGLSIVKGLVDLLGGELFLESEPGKGSTFYFIINKE
jgi:PAS domain S-box-containing protein